MKKIIYLIALMLSTGFLFLQMCDAAEPKTGGKPQYGGVLKIIDRVGPPSLVATVDIKSGAQYGTTRHTIMDHLFRYDVEGNMTPELVEEFDISKDGKIMTWKLRKGVKFHDGTEFNAKAVEYHFRNMKYGARRFANIEKIDIIDSHTMRLVLKKYDSTLLWLLAYIYGEVGSPTAAQKPTTPETEAKDHLVGTGPFKFVDWERDVSVKLTRFEDYWQKGKPYLDGLEFILIKDPVSASMAFQAGQAHILLGPTPQVANDLKKKGYNIVSSDSHTMYLTGDGANPDSPFADKRVRLAVEYAIDKKAISDVIGYGYTKPLTQICPSNLIMGYNPSIEGREYDPAMAKKLLAEAGYPKGFETRIIALISDDRDALGAIQGYLGEVGIKASLDLADKGRMVSMMKEGWKNALKFYMAGLDYNYAISLNVFFDQRGIYNKSMIRPPGFQEAIENAAVESDPDKRKEFVQSIVKMMYEEAMIAPLYTYPQIVAMQKNVHNTGLCEVGKFLWTPADTWISK
jgi:peptide/nickel transport system substrate-binding protein